MMSVRDLASVVRETLFYQYIFPDSSLLRLVPRYYGTYASCDGGWYAIILEDAGEPVQGAAQDAFSKLDRKRVK